MLLNVSIKRLPFSYKYFSYVLLLDVSARHCPLCDCLLLFTHSLKMAKALAETSFLAIFKATLFLIKIIALICQCWLRRAKLQMTLQVKILSKGIAINCKEKVIHSHIGVHYISRSYRHPIWIVLGKLVKMFSVKTAKLSTHCTFYTNKAKRLSLASHIF